MAVIGDEVFDSGLQLERTALAWQRTQLSLIVGSLAAGRGLETLLGPTSWLIAALGVGLSVGAFLSTRRRYREAHRHLTEVDERSLPGGAQLVAITATLCFVTGLAALAFVLHQIA